MSPTELYQDLIEESQLMNIPAAAGVDLELCHEAMQPHIQRYDQWIAKGHSGEMGYLIRGRDRRAEPRLVFPEAQSIFLVLIPYEKQINGAPSQVEGIRYARYIRNQDYHTKIQETLETLLQRVRDKSGLKDLRWKVCVDTSALLERSWAALAGLGWIGKNSLLIHPKLGSYVFIGAALINQPFHRGPSPIPNYCGNCTRCIEGCPTQAFEDVGILNSNKCISYWTLEKRGKLELEPQQLKSIGTWIAGCDVCQEVCPFNIKPVKQELSQLANPASSVAETKFRWEELLQETEAQYKIRVKDSALSRIKPTQFSRNLAISLKNAIEAHHHELPSQRGLIPLIEAKLNSNLVQSDPYLKSLWEEVLQSAKRNP